MSAEAAAREDARREELSAATSTFLAAAGSYEVGDTGCRKAWMTGAVDACSRITLAPLDPDARTAV